MAQFVEAIPHLLLRIFTPALSVCLVAWLVVLFVQLFSGKRHSCRFPSVENGNDRPSRATDMFSPYIQMVQHRSVSLTEGEK